MKLGLFIDYAARHFELPVERVQLAEQLGFDSVWTGEAYGSDAITPLACLAGQTRRIRLATGVAQAYARAPAMTAMQFGTLEHLAGPGRVIAGVGLSGPQVVEGWYGTAWQRPTARLRDTVAVMRRVFVGDKPVQWAGECHSLPLPADRGVGAGKALKPILDMNPALPIWLGTGSRAMVSLTAEIADGWIPMGFAPGMLDVYRPWLEDGFRRAAESGPAKSFADFHIQAQVQVALTDDVQAAIDAQKPLTALYIGGSGTRELNFHKDQMARRGFAGAAQHIQDLWLAGKREQAVAAVPDEYIDQGALYGDRQRIGRRLQAWLDSGADGLTLHTADHEAMRLLAELTGSRDTVE